MAEILTSALMRKRSRGDSPLQGNLFSGNSDALSSSVIYAQRNRVALKPYINGAIFIHQVR